MYRYVAFIQPPKSTDPVSHASLHIFVFVFVFISFFLFLLLHEKKKLKQLPPTTLRLAPVKRSLERVHVCRLLEIDRAIYTVGGSMIITNNNKLRQTTCFFSFHVVRVSEENKRKKKHKLRVSYPIPSHRPRADFG